MGTSQDEKWRFSTNTPCHVVVSKLDISFNRILNEQRRRLNCYYSANSKATLELISEILAERELALDLVLYFSELLEITPEKNVSVIFPISLAFKYGNLKVKEIAKAASENTNSSHIPNIDEMASKLAYRRRSRGTDCHSSALLYYPNGIDIENLIPKIKMKQLNGLDNIEVTSPTLKVAEKLELSPNSLLAAKNVIELELNPRMKVVKNATKFLMEDIIGVTIIEPSSQQKRLNSNVLNQNNIPDKYIINSLELWQIRATLRVLREQRDLAIILKGLQETTNSAIRSVGTENLPSERSSIAQPVASQTLAKAQNSYAAPTKVEGFMDETHFEIPAASNPQPFQTYRFLIKINSKLWFNIQNDLGELTSLRTFYGLDVRPLSSGINLQIEGTITLAKSSEEADKAMSEFIFKVIRPAAEKLIIENLTKGNKELTISDLYSVIQTIDGTLIQEEDRPSVSQISRNLGEPSSNSGCTRIEQSAAIQGNNLFERKENYVEHRILVTRAAFDESMGWYSYMLNRIKDKYEVSIGLENIQTNTFFDEHSEEQRKLHKVAVLCEPQNPDAIFDLKHLYEDIEELLSKEYSTKDDLGAHLWLRTDISEYMWFIRTNVELIERQNEGKFSLRNRGLMTCHQFPIFGKAEKAIEDLRNLAIREAKQLQLNFIKIQNIKRENIIQALKTSQFSAFIVTNFVDKGSNLLLSKSPLNINVLTQSLGNKVQIERTIPANQAINILLNLNDSSQSTQFTMTHAPTAATAMAPRSTDISQSTLNEVNPIELDADYYMFTTLYYKTELDRILGALYSIKIEDNDISGKKLIKINTFPPNKDILLKIYRLIQEITQNSARYRIPIPVALSSLAADLIKTLLITDVTQQKSSDPIKFNLKFYITSCSNLNINLIIDNKVCQDVVNFIRSILRKLVINRIHLDQNISNYFNILYNVDQFHLKGKGKIKILVYTADLTLVPVTAIVSSSDSELSFKGAAAAAILKAAGNDLISARAEFLQKSKGISLSSCWTSPGYNLPAEYIIHTATPILEWDSVVTNQFYQTLTNLPKQSSAKNLTKTIINALEEASRLQFYSIAVPLLGSGKASGNVQEAKFTCSTILLNGFVDAIKSSSFKDTSIQEIHLVNIEPTVTAAILDRIKHNDMHNSYQYLGQTKAYLVKQGLNPFSPANSTGVSQPQSIASPQFPHIYPPVVSAYGGQISGPSTYANTVASLKPVTCSPGSAAIMTSSVSLAFTKPHERGASAFPSAAPRFTGPFHDQSSNYVKYYVEASSQNRYYEDKYGRYYYYDVPSKTFFYYDPIYKAKTFYDETTKKIIVC